MMYIKIISIFIAALLGYEYFTLPDVNQAKSCFKTSMNAVDLCPKSSHYVKLNQISPYLKSAIVISEDASFYSHQGVDIDELVNSIKKNLRKFTFARGGSTITQQLVKNLFLNKNKTISRKLKEYVLAKRIEEKFSKNFILEKYLNVIELGKNIFGVKSGAEYYFQKHPSEITPLEASFLAFLLPSPEKYSVSFKKKELTPFARQRIRDILYKLYYFKKISQEEYESSKARLATMWKDIPQMDDEEDGNEYSDELDKEEMEILREKQLESIKKLEDGLVIEEI